MHNKKNISRVLVLLALIFAFAVTAAGCFAFGEIELDQESYTHEYGEIFMIPFATCTNGQEVTIQIFDAEGKEVPVEYGTATLEIGEYKMVFTAGNITKEVPLTCADTLKPEIIISVESSAAVGHWFTLPSLKADDISGIDTSKTKVELYKDGESTPVLTVPGERIRIENVSSYTLKATAVDTVGNVAVVEKRIKVIDRPNSEVLQDFSTELEPFHEITYGAGQPLAVWYDEYDGRQGVIALGCGGYENVPGGDYAYLWWTGLGMDSLNLVGATGFTFKIKVAPSVRLVAIKSSNNGDGGDLATGIVRDEWTEVTVSLVNDKSFSSMSYATIGIALAPGYKSEGECVWIDEVIVHYTPYPEYTVNVEDGSIDYAYDMVPEGCQVTVKHDKTKTPAGKAFSHYLINGERLWGSTFVVTGDTEITAVYVDLVTTERPIPEGAVMVEDFSGRGMASVVNKGQPALALSEWYVTYDGVAGVRSIGYLPNVGWNYLWWDELIPSYFDYDSYTHLTFRMKVTKSALRTLNLGDYNVLGKVKGDGEWIEVKIPISAMKDRTVGIANTYSAYGELVWIDQIYATVEEEEKPVPELKIPEGSVMISDFSNDVFPYIGHMMGDDAAHAYYSSYSSLDGRGGVFAMGSNCFSWMWYTGVGLDNMDLTGMGTITFRMKVNSKIVSLDLKIDGTHSIPIINKIPVKDEWTEVTFSVAELGFADITKAGITFVFGTPDGGPCEYVWLDQVYATPKDPSIPDELAIPEGATLISNYGKIVTPYIGHMMGNDAAHAYYNTYDVYDGRAGVFAMGSNCEAWMWYTGAGLDNMNLTGKTTITFRIKVSSSIKSLDLRIDGDTETGHSYAVKDLITVKDEWTELTVNIADLNFADITKANLTFRFGTPNGGECEYVWLDQVYVQ